MGPVGALALAGSLAVWAPQKSGSTAQLRGLAVLDAAHAWASGSGGTALRTQDGKSWQKLAVPGGETLDFRDVEALDAKTLVLMSAGAGDASRIYRSTDAGQTWTLVHTNPDKDGFYDAMAFWDEKNGILLGDPVGRYFVIRLTADGGATWTTPPTDLMPPILPGEGAFAASGTCLAVRKGGQRAWFVTGGAKVSRVFRTVNRASSWSSSITQVPAGNPSSGLFSVAFLDDLTGFVSGGDYKQPKLAELNGARTKDGGRTWTPVPISPSGFYSAIAAVPTEKDTLIAVGPAGTARSTDAGRSWAALDATSLNAVAFSGDGAGWAVGEKGTIVRYVAPPR